MTFLPEGVAYSNPFETQQASHRLSYQRLNNI